MSRETSYNFLPENVVVLNHKIGRKSQESVSVNVKWGHIMFSNEYVKNRGLDGKYIKFYVDVEKNALAWRVFTNSDGLEELKGHRRVTKYRSGDYFHYILSIAPILKSMNLKKEAYRGLKVRKYQFNGGYMDGIINYDYVKLED